ncbi:MAG: helix-turn-helix transcriptional regulator [Alphaproteobacteria bacterium]|nr:helix-turn-helix transcriptional regulator [Alphaproteobacteria bacterium]
MQFGFNEIWRGIDLLAKSKGMTPSGLAGKAGLNPTTFNKSKRESSDGRKRWPSTESLNKVLEATGVSMLDFLSLAMGKDMSEPRFGIPLINLKDAAKEGVFSSDGQPLNDEEWDAIEFPGAPSKIYALEISGNLFAPLYQDGTILIAAPTQDLRKSDRIILKTSSGAIILGELKRQSLRQIDILPLNNEGEESSFDLQNIQWMARILWASQ